MNGVASASGDWTLDSSAMPNDQLFAVLYGELRRLAGRELRRNGTWLSMGATTLLHEAFLNVSGREGLSFLDHRGFMAYAARAMRGLIIDRARSAGALRRGGAMARVTLDTEVAEQLVGPDDLLRVGELLEDLAALDEDLAQVVDLKFFCGLSVAEIAALRGCSERTVLRDWDKARSILRRMLREQPLPAAA